MQNLSHENEFDLHENEPVGETPFHKNGFARRLVLIQRKNSEITYLSAPLTTETINGGQGRKRKLVSGSREHVPLLPEKPS